MCIRDRSWIVEFTKFYWLSVSAGHICIIVPNFVKIGRSVAEILRFLEFSNWPPPPSWICLGHILTTHSEYLGVSITLQNLVMIEAVVTARGYAKRGICRRRVFACRNLTGNNRQILQSEY